MEGHCSTGQSPQWAVVPMEEEEESLFTFRRKASMTKALFEVRIEGSRRLKTYIKI
jgi:hypothetical protein